MRSPRRIIDANANRAREALRVMEDAARFLLDDETLARPLKELRHALSQALAALPGGGASELAARDTPADVGTAITTPSEGVRPDTHAIVIAAGKRLGEALRSIEEYAKLVEADAARTGKPIKQTPTVAARVETLRYHAYELEGRLVLALGTGRATQWKLCVIITESLCVHYNWLTVAHAAINAGADCVQLREKTPDSADLLARARLLVKLAREESAHPVSVIINDRPDIALLAGADGVHVGQNDLSVGAVRRLAGFDLLVGLSTANILQAKRALHEGADYCGVGPMFPTTTKDKDHIAGPVYMRKYAEHNPALPPHLAIGGITAERLPSVLEAGARGVAVSSSICGAKDPGAIVGAMVEMIEAT